MHLPKSQGLSWKKKVEEDRKSQRCCMGAGKLCLMTQLPACPWELTAVMAASTGPMQAQAIRGGEQEILALAEELLVMDDFQERQG